MRRSGQSWAMFGGLLVAVTALGQVTWGCKAFEPFEGPDGVGGGAGSPGSTSNSSTAAAGSVASSTGVGVGGSGESMPCESPSCVSVPEELDPRSIDIDKTDYIKGTFEDGSDEDKFTFAFQGSEGRVIRIESFDGSGHECGALDTALTWYEGEQFLSKADKDGSNECAALSLHMRPSSTHTLTLSPGDPMIAPSDYTLKLTRITCAKSFKDVVPSAVGTTVACVKGYVNADSTNSYTVPTGGKAIRAEIIEGNIGTPSDRCEGPKFDLDLSLAMEIDQEHEMTIEDDDSGRGDCPLIDGTGTNPIHPRASRTTDHVTLNVSRASTDVDTCSTEGSYILIVTLEDPPR